MSLEESLKMLYDISEVAAVRPRHQNLFELTYEVVQYKHELDDQSMKLEWLRYQSRRIEEQKYGR